MFIVFEYMRSILSTIYSLRRYITTKTLILGIVVIFMLLYTRGENIRQNDMDQSSSVLESSNPSGSDDMSTSEETALAPTATPTAIPTLTIDPDPIVTCTFPKDCNSTVETIKSSECSKKVCCQVKVNKFEIISSKDECTRIVTEEIKRMDEEYKKSYEEAMKKSREDADKAFAAYEERVKASLNTSIDTTSVDTYTDEYKARLKQIEEQEAAWKKENLLICRKNAENRYKQPPIGSMTMRTDPSARGLATEQVTYGQIVGESQEMRNALNRALQECNRLYSY